MPHHVYADDREIASKSLSNGKATLPPVDFCWTPPTSPATPTGVPIPYPNLCECPKITNGTRTVFIQRKMVGMEDKSYFSTSTGNEPATEALQKGIISHKIKGKGYFRFWMLTVKVEGAGVPRHGDPVTHNHGSPANPIPPSQEASAQTKKPECTAKEDVEKKCSSKNKPQANAEALKRDDISKEADGMSGLEETLGNAWMLQHCDGLWTKPGVPYYKNVKGSWEVVRKNLLDIASDPSASRDVWAKAGMTMPKGGREEVAKYLPKKGDELSSREDVKEKRATLQKALSNDMKERAEANECIKARKCQTVPYQDTNDPKKIKAGEGCCPGQTGHHIMPDSMFPTGHPCREGAKQREGAFCNQAPTICLEGASNNEGDGSHGDAHTALDKIMERVKEALAEMKPPKSTLPYADAKMHCLDALENAGIGHCRACLEKALDEHYQKDCLRGEKGELAPNSGKGGGNIGKGRKSGPVS